MAVHFIKIKPTGFYMDYKLKEELEFMLFKQSQCRKLWKIDALDRRKLECYSSNARQSRNGKNCSTCLDQFKCQLRLRLYFKENDNVYCLELPDTGYKNFREFEVKLLHNGLDIRNVKIIALVEDRGYWGEVTFTCDVCLS